jgi:hypothetical protein
MLGRNNFKTNHFENSIILGIYLDLVIANVDILFKAVIHHQMTAADSFLLMIRMTPSRLVLKMT